jgi:RNA binding exosome subunit
MPTWAFYAGGLAFTVIVQIATAAFVYGKLTERVSNHDEKLKSLDAEQSRQWETIGHHGERISSVEARVQRMEQAKR